jgi:hypothetical protein
VQRHVPTDDLSVEDRIGLDRTSLLLLGGYAVAAVLVGAAFVSSLPGTRVRRVLVVPALLGGLIAIGLATVYPAESVAFAERAVRDPRAWLIVLVAIFLAVATVDLLLRRVVPFASLTSRRLAPAAGRAVDTGMVIVLSLFAAATLLTIFVSLPTETPDREGTAQERILGTFDLPGHPMALVFDTERAGYISLGEGSIIRFELPDSGYSAPRLTSVVDGLEYPRGVAVAGGQLFVGVLGPLPCKESFPQCRWSDMPGVPYAEAERRIIEGSGGAVLGFEIDDDGSLRDRHTVLDGLPVASTEHGVNGLTVGPDGALYLALGNIDWLALEPPSGRNVEHPRLDLLGTVLRFSPDGTDSQIFARGLRNVYGLAFSSDGSLYGVDNDGITENGWRREEVVQIKRDADYGYPTDATFGDHRRRTDGPVWVIDAKGSAGIAWLPDPVAGGKLVMGSCGRVELLPLTSRGRGPIAYYSDYSGPQITRLLDVEGCVTSITSGPDDTLFVTVFGSGKGPEVYVIAPP